MFSILPKQFTVDRPDGIRVLLIEGDRPLARMLQEYLLQFDIRIVHCEDSARAFDLLDTLRFDLVVLDLCLPGVDGLELCRQVRNRCALPIVISSARSDIADKTASFMAGADDFLPKPYKPHELVLRIHSLARRHHNDTAAARESGKPLRFDPLRMEFVCRGERLKLTAAEFGILTYLVRQNGRVVTREELLDNTESIRSESSYKNIDVIVSRIRKKIEPDPKTPRLILSVRGKGYRLVNE